MNLKNMLIFLALEALEIMLAILAVLLSRILNGFCIEIFVFENLVLLFIFYIYINIRMRFL